MWEKCPFRAPDAVAQAAKRPHTRPFERQVGGGLGCSGGSSAGEMPEVVRSLMPGDPKIEILGVQEHRGAVTPYGDIGMWKRKDKEITHRPVAVPPAPAEPAVRREPTPAPAATPTPPAPRAAEPEMPRGVASIGKSVLIKGQIFSREDLFLDGEIEGTVEVPENRLTIGPHGKLQASIKAREVVVLGAVQGNVEASERIDLHKESKLVGDVKTGSIRIEDGAYFQGSIDMVKPEAAKPGVSARPVASGGPAAAAVAESKP